MAQGLLGGTFPSGMVPGGSPTTDSDDGLKMVLCSRLPRSSRENSTRKAASTGSSWAHTAQRFEPAARRLVGPWALKIKKGTEPPEKTKE